MSKCMWYWLIANASVKRRALGLEIHAAVVRANNNNAYLCWHILDRGSSSMRTTEICRAAYRR